MRGYWKPGRGVARRRSRRAGFAGPANPCGTNSSSWKERPMRGRTFAVVSLLAVLIGPAGGLSAVARAGDAEQLVIQYLQDQGAQGYTIIPVADDYVVDTFPDVAFFGVFFRQYPVAIRPPDGLASSNVFYVQDGKVHPLTNPSDLKDFFFNELGPLQTDKAIRDAGRSWLRLSEDFSQDLFFRFQKPAVTVQDGAVKIGRASCR